MTVDNHAATPGPWWVDEMPGKFRVLGEKRKPSGAIHMRFGADVCEIPFTDDGDLNSPLSVQQRGEAQADARLIASSPDLLRAAELGLQCARTVADLGAEDGDELAEQISAAIAKAKGENQ